MDNIDLVKEMNQLREEYGASLPGRVTGIADSLHQLSESDGVIESNELFRQVHSLSGSSSSFGYTRIHSLARNWELLIQDMIKRHVKLDEEKLAEFEKPLEQIIRLIDEGPDQKIESSLPHEQIITPHTDGQSFTIYLVEDDALIRQDITSQLEHLGFTVVSFSNATQASEALDKNLPDILLVDVMLPEGDVGGPEFVQSFNEVHVKSIPTIFISNRGDLEARLAAYRAGGLAYLPKPVDILQLVKNIDRLSHRKLSEPYRILIVDDTLELAKHYACVLEQAGMQAEVLVDPTTVLQAMTHFKPELVILDLYMPLVSGIEVAGVLRQHDGFLSTPIVFLSSENDRDIQLRALKAGDDFLQKPIRDSHLVEAISSRVERSRTLQELMYRDALTGVLNHSAIISRLEDELQKVIRTGSPVSFVMIDLDNFKAVNDQYGHPVGDLVLKSLTRVLTGRLRSTDLVGRYGGEEFALVLLDTEEELAVRIVDEIREHFGKLTLYATGHEIHVTFSAGVAQARHGDVSESLISRADERLYMAKKAGRNTVVATQDGV